MPNYNIYLSPEEDKILSETSKSKSISKTDLIVQIIKKEINKEKR